MATIQELKTQLNVLIYQKSTGSNVDEQIRQKEAELEQKNNSCAGCVKILCTNCIEL